MDQDLNPSSELTAGQSDMKMPPKLEELSSKREEREKRLIKILTTNDDLVTTVLRGHLIIEESLYATVAAHCQSPDRLKSVQLRFPQLVNLLRSLEKLPLMEEKDWTVLTEINSLRNALAHKVEPGDLSARIEHLVKTILGPEKVMNLQHPIHSKHSLTLALVYFLGKLDAFVFAHTALEESFRLRFMDAKENRP